MSTPWAQSSVLSSSAANAVSTPIALDPLAKMTAIQITASSSTWTGAFYVQATLDTPAFQSGGAGGVLPQPQPQWSTLGVSSGANSIINSTGPIGSLNTNDNSLMAVLLQPIAGLRLLASSSNPLGTGFSIILRALQSPAA